MFKNTCSQCIHRKYNSQRRCAFATLISSVLADPTPRFSRLNRAKTVATSGIYQHRRGLSDFFARLVYNFRHQYTSNFLELEDDLASPCISRLPTGKSRVVKYTNDDDARFRREIHDWSVNWRISQLHSTAFSLPIKREAEKLTSFENERSGRTR